MEYLRPFISFEAVWNYPIRNHLVADCSWYINIFFIRKLNVFLDSSWSNQGHLSPRRTIEISSKQECIAVGCIPPAVVAVGGGLRQCMLWYTPLGVALEKTPPWSDPSTSPLGVDLETCKACWDTTTPLVQGILGYHLQCVLGYHPTPVNRILDTRYWKYYNAPNFVCAR